MKLDQSLVDAVNEGRVRSATVKNVDYYSLVDVARFYAQNEQMAADRAHTIFNSAMLVLYPQGQHVVPMISFDKTIHRRAESMKAVKASEISHFRDFLVNKLIEDAKKGEKTSPPSSTKEVDPSFPITFGHVTVYSAAEVVENGTRMMKAIGNARIDVKRLRAIVDDLTKKVEDLTEKNKVLQQIIDDGINDALEKATAPERPQKPSKIEEVTEEQMRAFDEAMAEV